MWERIKFAAFAVSLAVWSYAVIGWTTQANDFGPTRGARVQQMRGARNESGRPFALVRLGLGAAAACVLAADAFRRDYDGPRALPVGVALVGLLSFGLLSIVYFVIWGRLPTKREGVLADAFCPECLAETLDRGAPGTSAINGVVGTALVGQADRCLRCGSTIKTLWVIVMMPLIPIASYRILPTGTPTFDRAWYLGRKRPAVYWPQVWPYLLIAAAVISAIAYAATRN